MAIQKKYFFIRYPRVVTMLVGLLLVCLLLLIAEWVLKKAGYKPGVLVRNASFNATDSLFVKTDYALDSNGIMSVSKIGQQLVAQKIAAHNKNTSGKMHDEMEYTLQKIVTAFAQILSASDTSEFAAFIQQIKEKNNSNSVDSAILHYIYNPINSMGFRSIEFNNYSTPKTKVLLLGDSFTFGLTASPITNCFADLLLANNLCVFNTGIVGADPAQYEIIARRLIPLLKPDVVCINYDLSNDNMFYYRTPQSNHPAWHVTNAGWLDGHPFGFYISAKQAMEYIGYLYFLPQSGSPFNRLCSKTRIGTQVWQLLYKIGLVTKVPSPDIGQLLGKIKQAKPYEKPVSIEYLCQIEQLCENAGADFIFSLIPDRKQVKPDLKQLGNWFPDIDFYVPQNLAQEDYFQTPTDGHFNNSGHKKYAQHLLGLIND